MVCIKANALDSAQARLRIAVLAPLNLDSAFNGYEYNLPNSKISQYFLSGLDFYTGAMMAVDSLRKENANIEVWVYDTHKQNQTFQQLADAMKQLNFSLVIAQLSSSAEQKILSEYSAQNSVPVVSATFPNDAYIANNPFFLLVNPTWQTHIRAIYDYLAANYKGKKVLLFTRKGSMESRISDELYKLNADKNINFSTVVLRDNFSDAEVTSKLNNSTQNVIVCGSLYENFGKSLIRSLNDSGLVYANVLIGMPTWSGMSDITGKKANNLQIVITSSYNYLKSTPVIDSISQIYKSTYYTQPSDMVLKGYETMYHFTKLMLAYPDSLINRISENVYKISNNYIFQPVRLSNTSFIPDYLENKKIYYIKIEGGKVQSID